ncbi:MAG: hypothetical protein JOY84_04075 [Curvibacter sp.]|nr:hypothetical protein [Curvibacter sp.]
MTTTNDTTAAPAKPSHALAQTLRPLRGAPALDVADGAGLDNRIVREQQLLSTLCYLHRFQWLTARMLAPLVFPHASQALPLARRLLNSMQSDSLLIRRAVPQCGSAEAFLLSAKGAKLLHESTGADAASGQNVSLGNAIHRAAANWFCITALGRGWDVATEHELATGITGVHAVGGKVFDGLLLGDIGANGVGDAVAIEVERAWKNREERKAIVDVCIRHLGAEPMTMLTDSYALRQMSIVATDMSALRHMSASFLEAYRDGRITEAQLQAVNVCLLPVSRSLVPGETEEGNLWFDVLLPALN